MKNYVAAVWKCRYFWGSLVSKDLQSRYKGSVLGIGWSLLHPIAMTALLTAVFSQAFNVPVVEYAPFLMVGLAFWNYVSGVTVLACRTFYAAENYIRQYPAPMSIYPLRTSLGAMFHLGVSLVASIVFVWCMKGFGNVPALLSLLPTIVLLIAVGWAVSVLSGLAAVIFPDFNHLVDVGLQLFLYATPILYPRDAVAGSSFAWVLAYNPLNPFLSLLREPILNGTVPSLTLYATAGGITAMAFLAAVAALARLERRLIFHL
ncbi:MAG: ABC transporter permease [Planctomycetia bacterium]